MYSIEAYHAGRADAARDIRAGRLVLEIFVSPFGGNSGASILAERYGIESKIVGTDLVIEESRSHAKGYNELMRAEIERRFGVGVIEKAAAEAEANWKPSSPKPAWKDWAFIFLAGPPILLLYIVVWPIFRLSEFIDDFKAKRRTMSLKK